MDNRKATPVWAEAVREFLYTGNISEIRDGQVISVVASEPTRLKTLPLVSRDLPSDALFKIDIGDVITAKVDSERGSSVIGSSVLVNGCPVPAEFRCFWLPDYREMIDDEASEA